MPHHAGPPTRAAITPTPARPARTASRGDITGAKLEGAILTTVNFTRARVLCGDLTGAWWPKFRTVPQG